MKKVVPLWLSLIFTVAGTVIGWQAHARFYSEPELTAGPYRLFKLRGEVFLRTHDTPSGRWYHMPERPTGSRAIEAVPEGLAPGPVAVVHEDGTVDLVTPFEAKKQLGR